MFQIYFSIQLSLNEFTSLTENVSKAICLGLMLKHIILFAVIDFSPKEGKHSRYVLFPYIVMTMVTFNTFITNADIEREFTWITFTIYIITTTLSGIKIGVTAYRQNEESIDQDPHKINQRMKYISPIIDEKPSTLPDPDKLTVFEDIMIQY